MANKWWLTAFPGPRSTAPFLSSLLLGVYLALEPPESSAIWKLGVPCLPQDSLAWARCSGPLFIYTDSTGCSILGECSERRSISRPVSERRRSQSSATAATKEGVLVSPEGTQGRKTTCHLAATRLQPLPWQALRKGSSR